MPKALHVILILMSMCGSLKAQHPSYFTFGTEHGLPTSQVYAAFETEEGVLYVAHELGLSRYNGIEFQTVELTGIKPGTDCLGIYRKSSGTWVVMATGEFFKLLPSGLQPFRWNAELQKNNHGTVYDFCFRDNNLHLATSSGYFVVGSSGQIKSISGNNAELNILRGDTDLIYHHRQMGNQAGPNLQLNGSMLPVRIQSNGGRHYGRAMGDSTLFWAGETLFSISRDSIINTNVGSSIISVHRITDQIYVSTRQKGLLVFSLTASGLKLESQLLDGAFIGIVHHGPSGLWVADLNQGIHFIPNPDIRNYPTPQKVRAMHGSDSELLIALRGHNSGFWQLQDEGYALEAVQDIPVWNPGEYLYVTRFQKTQGIVHALNGPALLASPTQSGSVEILDYAIHVRDSTIGGLQWSLDMSGITCAEWTDDHGILIGTRTGLFRFDPDSPAPPQKLVDSIGSIRIIKQMPQGNSLVCSDSYVLSIEPGIKKPKVLFHSPDFIISTAHVYDELLLIGSMKGLHIIGPDSGRTLLNHSDGVINSNILHICSFGKLVALGTERGLSLIPVELLRSKLNEPQQVPTVTAQVMESNSDEVRVNLEVRSLNPWKEVIMEYRLNRGSFIPLEGSQIILSNLRPGEYDMEVRSRYSDRDWTGHVTLGIYLPTPIYRRWWFSATIVLALALVVIFIIRRRNRMLTERLETEKLIANLRMSALNAQMNPHFLFNALNTIQGLMGRNPKLLFTYVSDLAKLLRIILESSAELSVPIEQEVELNRIFCQVENIKQDSKVSFDVIYQEESLRTAEIPSLVIQPFVENAMWHAFLDSSEDPTIRIIISRYSRHVIRIRIEDNGLGINSSSNKKKAHESMGVQIVRQRVELFNGQTDISNHLQIKDLSDICPNQHGTRVDLYLHYPKSDDIQDGDNRRRPNRDQRVPESGVPV